MHFINILKMSLYSIMMREEWNKTIQIVLTNKKCTLTPITIQMVRNNLKYQQPELAYERNVLYKANQWVAMGAGPATPTKIQREESRNAKKISQGNIRGKLARKLPEKNPNRLKRNRLKSC